TWAGRLTLLMRSGSADYGIAHDALGSTVALVSASGAAAASAAYDPFGNQLAKSGSVASPLGWEGEYQDATSGLDQLNARDLSSATGEFLSPD
ncbi:hypothetical protein Q8G41_27370, partial [Klebsiella pneumoniae]|uniref:hypothetical protein n=1 Tax=Klebsiella pneumoniae TaxID=573 RepID=UPI003013FE55